MKLKKFVAITCLTLGLATGATTTYADTDFLMGMATGVSNGSAMSNLGAAVNSMNQQTANASNQQYSQASSNDDENDKIEKYLIIAICAIFPLMVIGVALTDLFL